MVLDSRDRKKSETKKSLLQAQEPGRNIYQFTDQNLGQREASTLPTEARHGVRCAGRLQIHQPKYDCLQGGWGGAECHWKHPGFVL